ncbi:DNA invertase Pin-like site-specific DNA recombinase [Novosphingobium gossypii]
MLGMIEAGDADMLVCEALDRLARGSEDIACPGKKLSYHSIDLHTVTGGVSKRSSSPSQPAGSALSQEPRRQDAAQDAADTRRRR